MSWPSPSPCCRAVTSDSITFIASDPFERSIGMQPAFQANQPITGTRRICFFMMKARSGAWRAMIRMSKKL